MLLRIIPLPVGRLKVPAVQAAAVAAAAVAAPEAFSLRWTEKIGFLGGREYDKNK